MRVLDDRTLAVVSDPSRWMRETILRDCDSAFRAADNAPPWKRELVGRYASKEQTARFGPGLLDAVAKADHFAVSSDGIAVATTVAASWPQAVREIVLPDGNDGPAAIRTDAAEVAYVTYLRLDPPMSAGKRYVVDDTWGDHAELSFDPASTISWAIKVNQVGYAASAPRKYAYVGAWLGPAGPLALDRIAGGAFHVLRPDGTAAFTGVVRQRGGERWVNGEPIYGEDVYELDFSTLTEVGRFRIAVDGVGASWPFAIDDAVLGEQHYVHARGLFHARCAPIAAAYTRWPRGDGHGEARRAAFPPDQDDYKDHAKDGWGFQNESGAFAAHDSFEMVRLTATDQIVGGARGGWHDAADFDRRTFHLSIVLDLSLAYALSPSSFTDGQLGLPESGNHVPDLLDEAAIGIDHLLPGQEPDGRVGTWIEATRHPSQADPALDPAPYYLSLATRSSSLQFATAAATLARALALSGNVDRSLRYVAAAERAYAFGASSTDPVSISFSVAGAKHTWKEPPTPDAGRLFDATVALALATGDPVYRAALATAPMSAAFRRAIAEAHWRGTPLALADMALSKDALPSGWADTANGRLTEIADTWLARQEANPYRKAWYTESEAYFPQAAWGASGYAPIRYLVAAYRTTGDARYRGGALLALDWMNGANPQGRTSTTGLGIIAPISVLHLPSRVDGVEEPVPGITIFGYTGQIPFVAGSRAYGVFDAPRADVGFSGMSTVLLPSPLDQGVHTVADVLATLRTSVPFWRRLVLLEDGNPPSTEFSVHETIGPAVVVTGLLLSPGYSPSAELRARLPRSADDIREARIALP